ncbi:hypothetical protein U2F26_10865 [Micromonospora sp. 4G57]|uniref:Flagellar basal body-associated protein FliL n=1 Tax=Micromonospora sicca TaxID=2202420 RepID=A0ABU5J7Y8_9ACTN|nr:MULTISPECIES: hypothetical protein [unclassified Micromonospora]MDZ5443230.1 hypothetical protein [Micromonospora sp. 4G57]MDZ5488653.1 hypothetical protein [Micromonospora sp. 4G53]
MSQPPSNPYPGSYPPPQQPGGYPPQQPGPQYGGGYPPQQPGPQYGGGYPPQQPGPQYGEGYPPQQPGPQYGGYPGEQSAPQAGSYLESGQPSYGAPAGPPPKKSNVGRILLITLAVVVVLCLGGGAVLFFAAKDEVGDVVGATKTRVTAPETLAGRTKSTDPALVKVAKDVEDSLRSDTPNATSAVSAFYGSAAKKDLVMVGAASGLNPDPAKSLDANIRSLGTSGLEIGEMKTVDAGPLGGEAKCGDAKAGQVPLGICVWSDRGSTGVIGLYFKTGAEAQAQFSTMRGQIEQKG